MLEAISRQAGPILGEIKNKLICEVDICETVQKYPKISAAVILTISYLFYSVISFLWSAISSAIGVIGFGVSVLTFLTTTPVGWACLATITGIYLTKFYKKPHNSEPTQDNNDPLEKYERPAAPYEKSDSASKYEYIPKTDEEIEEENQAFAALFAATEFPELFYD